MQFKTIGRISVGDLGLEICGQIYDVDGPEWAFLYTNTASDTEALRDEGDFRVCGDLDAKLARPYNRA